MALWRRRRDLNPRYPFGVYTISNRARSASYATSPYRFFRSALIYYNRSSVLSSTNFTFFEGFFANGFYTSVTLCSRILHSSQGNYGILFIEEGNRGAVLMPWRISRISRRHSCDRRFFKRREIGGACMGAAGTFILRKYRDQWAGSWCHGCNTALRNRRKRSEETDSPRR